MVEETFRLRINISSSLTGWCSESPAFGKLQNVSGKFKRKMRQGLLILLFFVQLTSYGQVNNDSERNITLDKNESKLLNEYFDNKRGTFDFTDKKLCFISGSSGTVYITKQDYFSDIKKWAETNDRIATTLHVLTYKEKIESGGYDAIVTAWVKLLPYGRRRKIIKELGTSR